MVVAFAKIDSHPAVQPRFLDCFLEILRQQLSLLVAATVNLISKRLPQSIRDLQIIRSTRIDQDVHTAFRIRDQLRRVVLLAFLYSSRKISIVASWSSECFLAPWCFHGVADWRECRCASVEVGVF